MVDAVSQAATFQSKANSSSARLAENFDTFLSLLTAQLQNQDPLEPVDSSEFTNQLVQFSGVEQQIQTNSAIAELITVTASSTAASLSSYLGKAIEVNSISADLQGESIDWIYEMPADVEKAKLSIQDIKTGEIVYSEDMSNKRGRFDFSWDGEQTSGDDLTSGSYALVIRAENAEGDAVNVPVRVKAHVDGIDLSSGRTMLSTNAGLFDFASVLSVTESRPSSEDKTDTADA